MKMERVGFGTRGGVNAYAHGAYWLAGNGSAGTCYAGGRDGTVCASHLCYTVGHVAGYLGAHGAMAGKEVGRHVECVSLHVVAV